MTHLTPLEQICPLEKFEVGLQTPPLPKTPCIAYGKGKKIENLLFILQWSTCIPINLKGTRRAFNGTFEEFYLPHSSQMWKKLPFLTKAAIWDLKHEHRVQITFNSCLNNNSFHATVNAFWPWQKQNSD